MWSNQCRARTRSVQNIKGISEKLHSDVGFEGGGSGVLFVHVGVNSSRHKEQPKREVLWLVMERDKDHGYEHDGEWETRAPKEQGHEG